jgi:hypothetical protein
MATTRPFAYNPSQVQISGTTQLGDLAIGVDSIDYSENPGGVQWWNGPDEELGYVIALPVPNNSQPTDIPGVGASVGFFRSGELNEGSFIGIANYVSGQSFVDSDSAKTWLNNNGYWTSWVNLTPTPTPTSTITPTPTSTITPTPTITPTSTITPTPTITPTSTITPTPTSTSTPTPTSTSTPTPTITPTVTPTSTITPTPTITPTITPTSTITPTPTSTSTPTPTNTPTSTPTPTLTPTPSSTPSGNKRVLILGDSAAPTVGTYISTYLTSLGTPITYSAVTMGTTYTGNGGITTSNYDAVLIYTNASQIGTATLATALTNYVNSGGSVVSGVFLWNLYPSGYNFTGTTAFNFTNSQGTSVGNFTVVSATTITNNIGTALPASFSNNNPTLVSGAVSLATFTNGQNCLAVKHIGSSRNVSINAFPANITSSTSTICKMFGNAILYAAGVPIPQIQSFTATGTTTWTAPAGVTSVEYLVVGGGGGGGNGYDSGGGGGAGGGMVLTGTTTVVPGNTYTVTVGGGGIGGADTRTNNPGTDGVNSVFDTITALGGQGGYGSRTTPGGAGVGGAAQNSNITSGRAGNGGSGGNAGGGGGGAIGAGTNRTNSSTAGVGGTGLTSTITLTSVVYGGGGNGGTANVNNNDGAAGSANTGKGGGAGNATSSNSAAGGNGGSGIVVLKYV